MTADSKKNTRRCLTVCARFSQTRAPRPQSLQGTLESVPATPSTWCDRAASIYCTANQHTDKHFSQTTSSYLFHTAWLRSPKPRSHQ